uniref:MATH domain-containing protein n=1 Tax=Parastrongyloides trichosuri TaxID=131310 RepID=A0A0N4ZG42_PARTI
MDRSCSNEKSTNLNFKSPTLLENLNGCTSELHSLKESIIEHSMSRLKEDERKYGSNSLPGSSKESKCNAINGQSEPKRFYGVREKEIASFNEAKQAFHKVLQNTNPLNVKKNEELVNQFTNVFMNNNTRLTTKDSKKYDVKVKSLDEEDNKYKNIKNNFFKKSTPNNEECSVSDKSDSESGRSETFSSPESFLSTDNGDYVESSPVAMPEVEFVEPGCSNEVVCDNTIRFVINKVSKLKENLRSPPKWINGSYWRILTMFKAIKSHSDIHDSCFGFFVQCLPNSYDDKWVVSANCELSIRCLTDKDKRDARKTSHDYTVTQNDWGYSCYMKLDTLLDPKNGFCINDTIIVEAIVDPQKPRNILTRENFLKEVEKYKKIIDFQESRGDIDKALDMVRQASNFCKGKCLKAVKEFKERMDVLNKQKIAECIEKLENATSSNKQKTLKTSLQLRKTIISADGKKNMKKNAQKPVVATKTKVPAKSEEKEKSNNVGDDEKKIAESNSKANSFARRTGGAPTKQTNDGVQKTKKTSQDILVVKYRRSRCACTGKNALEHKSCSRCLNEYNISKNKLIIQPSNLSFSYFFLLKQKDVPSPHLRQYYCPCLYKDINLFEENELQAYSSETGEGSMTEGDNDDSDVSSVDCGIIDEIIFEDEDDGTYKPTKEIICPNIQKHNLSYKMTAGSSGKDNDVPAKSVISVKKEKLKQMNPQFPEKNYNEFIKYTKMQSILRVINSDTEIEKYFTTAEEVCNRILTTDLVTNFCKTQNDFRVFAANITEMNAYMPLLLKNIANIVQVYGDDHKFNEYVEPTDGQQRMFQFMEKLIEDCKTGAIDTRKITIEEAKLLLPYIFSTCVKIVQDTENFLKNMSFTMSNELINEAYHCQYESIAQMEEHELASLCDFPLFEEEKLSYHPAQDPLPLCLEKIREKIFSSKEMCIVPVHFVKLTAEVTQRWLRFFEMVIDTVDLTFEGGDLTICDFFEFAKKMKRRIIEIEDENRQLLAYKDFATIELKNWEKRCAELRAHDNKKENINRMQYEELEKELKLTREELIRARTDITNCAAVVAENEKLKQSLNDTKKNLTKKLENSKESNRHVEKRLEDKKQELKRANETIASLKNNNDKESKRLQERCKRAEVMFLEKNLQCGIKDIESLISEAQKEKEKWIEYSTNPEYSGNSVIQGNINDLEEYINKLEDDIKTWTTTYDGYYKEIEEGKCLSQIGKYKIEVRDQMPKLQSLPPRKTSSFVQSAPARLKPTSATKKDPSKTKRLPNVNSHERNLNLYSYPNSFVGNGRVFDNSVPPFNPRPSRNKFYTQENPYEKYGSSSPGPSSSYSQGTQYSPNNTNISPPGQYGPINSSNYWNPNQINNNDKVTSFSSQSTDQMDNNFNPESIAVPSRWPQEQLSYQSNRNASFDNVMLPNTSPSPDITNHLLHNEYSSSYSDLFRAFASEPNTQKSYETSLNNRFNQEYNIW